MDDDKRVSLFKAIFIVLKRRLNLKNILLMSLLLAFNTFAWFIYASKISSGIDVHVKSWGISFEVDNDVLEEYVNFEVATLYPGMEDYSDSITIRNAGESDARLTYEILSISVFGEEYVAGVDGVTSSSLQDLIDSYPFRISLGSSNETVTHGGGVQTFEFSVVWDYESGNDDVDTDWGFRAYEFYEDHSDDDLVPIVINVKIKAIQI